VSTVRIPVNGSTEPALIDHWNLPLVQGATWALNTHGYACARMGRRPGRLMMMHRLIVGDPPGVQIDHANRNKLDNREENLREATSRQQMHNTGRHPSTSPFKGTSYNTRPGRRKRWMATINVPVGTSGRGRRWVIGYFLTPEEAGEAYDREALRLFGEFSCTNKDLGLL
jgi:hypothetical protein